MDIIDFGIDQNKRICPKDILMEKNTSKKAAMIQYLAQESRVDIFDLIHRRGNGHWGGSASAAEIIATLYFHVMNVNPEEPANENRDRFVVSKGHAAPMLYTIIAKRGFFPLEEMKTFRQLNSRLQGHPCMNKTPGIEMSTGALGHGISVTTGMALASSYLNSGSWSIVLIGDGCLNEGESWEGIMTAAKFKPQKLVVMVDYNKVQLDGHADEIMPLDPLPEKFREFGFHVAPEIYDGHNVNEIIRSWDWIKQQDKWPIVVIYDTHKGKGVSFMEDNHKWHGAPIDIDSYKEGRPELINKLKQLEEAI